MVMVYLLSSSFSSFSISSRIISGSISSVSSSSIVSSLPRSSINKIRSYLITIILDKRNLGVRLMIDRTRSRVAALHRHYFIIYIYI